MKIFGFATLLIAFAFNSSAFLNLHPASTLQLPGDLSNGELSISLKHKPVGKVMVYFDAPKTRFDRCALEFTPHNWGHAQKIRAISESFATVANDGRNIPITFQAWSDDCSWEFQGHTFTISTVRDRRKEGLCIVVGDPHYKSFDAPFMYHYQGEGVFYLVRSDILTVQAWQGHCWRVASCIYAIGVRYGEAVFIVDGSQPDIEHYVRAITNTNGVTISKTRTSEINTINLAFNSGSNIKLDFVKGTDWYTNVYINLGTYLHGRVKGLCGTYDDNQDNDFTSLTGKVFSNHDINRSCDPDVFNMSPTFSGTALHEFGNSWRVPHDDNIFENKRVVNRLPINYYVNQCIRPPASSIKCAKTDTRFVEPVPCLDRWNANWAVCGTRRRRAVIPNSTPSDAVLPPPTALANIPAGSQAMDTIIKYNGKPPSIAKLDEEALPDIPEHILEKAKSLCATKIAEIVECPLPGAWDSAVLNCQIDIRARANPEAMYKIHNMAYTEICSHALLSLASESSSSVSEKAKAAIKAHSFGNSECDGQCLQCTERGCTMCIDSSKYEVKAGHCVPITDQPNVDDKKFFGTPPTESLVSRNEVAPRISTSEALGQTNGNLAINPQAVVIQSVSKGPTAI